jgi:hypothetical protein
MGSGLVVANVSRALKESFAGWLIANPGDLGTRPIAISALPPDPSTLAGGDRLTAHLYLYRIDFMAALRQDPPVRVRERGIVPPDMQGLELGYLIGATTTREFDRELVLGAALYWAHHNPVLTVEVPVSGSGAPPESWQLRITLKVLTTEALAALCSAIEGSYRAHLAIDVRVVLRTPKAAGGV